MNNAHRTLSFRTFFAASRSQAEKGNGSTPRWRCSRVPLENQARKNLFAHFLISVFTFETFNMAVDMNRRIKYRSPAGSFPDRLNHRRSTPPIRRDYISIESSKSEQPLWLSYWSRFIGLRIRQKIVQCLLPLPFPPSPFCEKKSNAFYKSNGLRRYARTRMCKRCTVNTVKGQRAIPATSVLFKENNVYVYKLENDILLFTQR